jgi:hypothetical protein
MIVVWGNRSAIGLIKPFNLICIELGNPGRFFPEAPPIFVLFEYLALPALPLP